jgi:hypothetical protein
MEVLAETAEIDTWMVSQMHQTSLKSDRDPFTLEGYLESCVFHFLVELEKAPQIVKFDILKLYFTSPRVCVRVELSLLLTGLLSRIWISSRSASNQLIIQLGRKRQRWLMCQQVKKGRRTNVISGVIVCDLIIAYPGRINEKRDAFRCKIVKWSRISNHFVILPPIRSRIDCYYAVPSVWAMVTRLDAGAKSVIRTLTPKNLFDFDHFRTVQVAPQLTGQRASFVMNNGFRINHW